MQRQAKFKKNDYVVFDYEGDIVLSFNLSPLYEGQVQPELQTWVKFPT